jgi:DnaJ-class molecular chaperone with C-terminal Zn finger domain
MAERNSSQTFYGVLGVAADAERERIRRAYRSLVKECHPDVSDDPDAPERFKRLTVARDVLLDDTERERYDRVGHDAYVRMHVDSAVWEGGQPDAAPADTEPRTGETGHTTGTATDGASTGAGTDRVEWLGEAERHGETGPTTGSAGGQHDRYAAASPRDGRAWQQASRMYSRAGSEAGRQSSPVGRVAEDPDTRAVDPDSRRAYPQRAGDGLVHVLTADRMFDFPCPR